MNNIPTAEELIYKKDNVFFVDSPSTQGTAIDIDSVKELMIEFTKLHLEAALKTVIENVVMEDVGEINSEGEWNEYYIIDKKSILNAYPIENIK
jgi:hypothetical protein